MNSSHNARRVVAGRVSPLAALLILLFLGTLFSPRSGLAGLSGGFYHSEHYEVDERGPVISTAGDVNGDGHSDIIIGAPFDPLAPGDIEEGAVRVYLGGDAYPDQTPAWTLQVDAVTWGFGFSLSAGDVNGDGYDDILIGAPGYSNGESLEGAAYLYLGSPSGLSSTYAWSVEGNQIHAYLGWSVAIVGDVTGDGRAEAVIGVPFWDNPETNEGKIDLYVGVSGGLAIFPAATREGNIANRMFGEIVAPAGDVNADGRADILVGAPRDNSGPLAFQGRAYLYLASGTTIAATPALTLAGTEVNEYFGYVATAGDINGDGYSDFLVGAPYVGASDVGRVSLFMGGATISSTPAWTRDGAPGASIGLSLATAGDANGDGYADIVIGVPESFSGDGSIDVYWGGPTAPAVYNSTTFPGDPSVAGSFGTSVATAGDVDNDGFSDLLVSTYLDAFLTGAVIFYRGIGDRASTAFSWSEQPNVAGSRFGNSLALGDVNADGFDDVIAGAFTWDNVENDEGRVLVFNGGAGNPGTTPAWQYEPNNNFAHLGSSVGAADVNGDGYVDVLAGASQFTNGQTNEGKAFVFHGSAAGPSAAPDWSLESNQSSGYLGASIGSAGDVNGDGYQDVILGSPGWDNSQINEGRVQVFHGGASGLSLTPAWTYGSNSASASLGISVATAGDVNADGFSDVIVGANGFTGAFSGEGRALVFIGSPTGLTGTPFLTVDGGSASIALGTAVSSVGDYNADGYSDVAIAVPGQDNVRVYLGGSSGMTYLDETLPIDGGGRAVAPAGDVNADGFSDFLTGALSYTNGQTNEGAVQFVYGGGATITVRNVVLVESNLTSSQYGTAVAGAGDVNGDGFSDVVVGAPNYSGGQNQEGLCVLYKGGGYYGGLDRKPQQRRVDDTAAIGPLGVSDDGDEFRVNLRGRSAEGRATRLRFDWRMATIRTLLDMDPVQTDGVAHDTGSPGSLGSVIDLSKVIGTEFPSSPVHWEVRTRSGNPLFPHSRWFSPAWSAVNETDLRLAGAWSAVDETSPVADPIRFTASPNPFQSRTRLTLTTEIARDVDVVVFDPMGRRVRVLGRGSIAAGTHDWIWDGHDEQGHPAATGLYYIRALGLDRPVVARVALIR